jgi:primary-amine oxidase
VTPYAEDRLYPAGFHVNQSEGGEDFGLQKWVNEDGAVENEDVILWLTFGATHFARAEVS